MGGIAALAQAAGHRVTGADAAVYPPMSEQLRALGIDLVEGWDPAQLDPAPDMVVVGNAMSRGNAAVEAMLERGLSYTSGPQWLSEHLLQGRWVIAVAGTHGKTTVATMVAHILMHAGLDPGFLIGGVPMGFEQSARAGSEPFFVVEADEYDTAFFDKRSKFVHYRPRTVILNNLEFDHADIFPDLGAIETQFHHLVRTVPGNGLIVANASAPALQRVLARGCWTPVEHFEGDGAWQAVPLAADGSAFEVHVDGVSQGTVNWSHAGRHMMSNALAAIAATRHAGVPVATSIEALATFAGVRRRMERRGTVGGITVWDDFAHHPTAIACTLEALRGRVGVARIFAVVDPRSNTMRMGAHGDALAASLVDADRVLLHTPPALQWDAGPVLAALGPRAAAVPDAEAAVAQLVPALAEGDHVLVMSNGAFGAIHGKLLAALEQVHGQRT